MGIGKTFFNEAYLQFLNYILNMVQLKIRFSANTNQVLMENKTEIGAKYLALI